MIIVPQPPRISGTSDEKVMQLYRYTVRLAEELSVWLNVDTTGTDSTSTTTESRQRPSRRREPCSSTHRL